MLATSIASAVTGPAGHYGFNLFIWRSGGFAGDITVEGVKLRIMQPNLQQDQKFNYAARNDVMRRYLEKWITTDVHTHMGTEWLTGQPVGMWYAVNDYAMVQTIDAYVRAMLADERVSRALDAEGEGVNTIDGPRSEGSGLRRVLATA